MGGPEILANDENTSVEEIVKQMLEPRALPLGAKEFDIWSDRIISGALLPANSDEDKEKLIQSQKFALATMLMHLSPTTDHECDGYFIKSLRKSVINQVAHAKMEEIRNAAKARLAIVESPQTEVTVASDNGATDGETSA